MEIPTDEALLGNLLIVAGLSENQIEVILLWLTGAIYKEPSVLTDDLTTTRGDGRY